MPSSVTIDSALSPRAYTKPHAVTDMCDLVKMSLSDDPYAPVVTDTYQTDCTAGLPSPETVISRMSIHFQVIVDIARHSVYGVEALARSSDGTPTPALIQRAEEEGWYPRLEFALLTLAMEAASQLPPHLVCTLNMSASAITDEPVRHLMRRHSDRHWGLEILEFSHRVPIDNTFRDRLREFDCDLLIDDAGEGYSDVQRIRASSSSTQWTSTPARGHGSTTSSPRRRPTGQRSSPKASKPPASWASRAASAARTPRATTSATPGPSRKP